MDALEQTRFLILWVVVAGLGLVSIAAVIVWAIRSRQFSDQDRARYLPLHARIPDDAENKDNKEPNKPGEPKAADRADSGNDRDGDRKQ